MFKIEIKQINNYTARQIIDNEEPIGLFFYSYIEYCVDTNKQMLINTNKEIFVGIDNSTGDVWVEEFESLEECTKWLNGEEDEERELILSKPTIGMYSYYRHFKGKWYAVLHIAEHTETNEKYVVYEALYGNHDVYVRPYDMFMEETPKDKINPTGQKYRFMHLSELNITHEQFYKAVNL